MAGPNGVARIGARMPIVLRPNTITFTIEREDGETVALAGYKKGPGCPITVLMAYDEALAEAEEESPNDDDRQALSASRYYARLMRSERMLRRGLLQAVIPGLDEPTANVLASDDGPWRDMLTELGWWNGAMAEDATEDGDPEASAVETGSPTGSTASPDSSSPTATTRRRRA